MATTIKESFRQFSSNLNITDKQTEAVSTCRKNVVGKIGGKLSLHPDQPSKLIGSYDRDTLTKYLSEGDVDVMVVLHHGNNKDWDNNDGVKKALNKCKAILGDAYPKTECSIDRNCVTMKLSQFRLDVVPAFRYTDGYYKIPDTYRNKWIKTDPTRFSEEITRINKNMDDDFIPLIKMVKAWNRKYKKRLRGFHLECMMVSHYRNYSESYTYDSMLNIFFSKLPGYLNSAAYDPITGDRVDLYLGNEFLGNKRTDFVARAERAAVQVQEAYDGQEEYTPVAIGEWKELFGEFFPTYG